MGVKDEWNKGANTEQLGNVQAEVDALKKSVSDGKKSVAEAITDKGIITATDAAFATMADNISQISTLATETADATAIAAQILSGKRAYVKGAPVVGTMPNNGGVSAAISSGSLKAGYTSGGAIANLVASNVKQGVNIGGIIGTYETGYIFESFTEYNDGYAFATTKTYPFAVEFVASVSSSTIDGFWAHGTNYGNVKVAASNGNKTIRISTESGARYTFYIFGRY